MVKYFQYKHIEDIPKMERNYVMSAYHLDEPDDVSVDLYNFALNTLYEYYAMGNRNPELFFLCENPQ
jgi:hypothetical protein